MADSELHISDATEDGAPHLLVAGGVARRRRAGAGGRRSEERRLAHASHAGAPAFLIGLEDTPELNGVRVKLEEPLFAAGAPTEEKRRRVRRRDNSRR